MQAYIPPRHLSKGTEPLVMTFSIEMPTDTKMTLSKWLQAAKLNWKVNTEKDVPFHS